MFRRNPVSRGLALALALFVAPATAESVPVAAAGNGLEVHEIGFLWETAVAADEVSAADLLGDLPSHVRTEAKETPIEARGNPEDGPREPFAPATASVPSIPTTTVGDPFVFFHAREPITIDVRIDFEHGRPIAWYPRTEGYHVDALEWPGVKVSPRLPAGRNLKPIRETDGQNTWRSAQRARELPGAAYLEHGTQVERYLFYEAAVRYPTVLVYEPADSGEAPARILNAADFAFHDLYVFPGADMGSEAPIIYLRSLEPGARLPLAFDDAEARATLGAVLIDRRDFVEHLARHGVEAGLTAEESELLVRTAVRPEFLQARAPRAIYRLPREVYDALYPLEITPAPERTVRVGIVLVPALERRSVGHYLDIVARGRAMDRARANGALVSLGAAVASSNLEARLTRARGAERRNLEETRELLAAESQGAK